MRGSTAVLLLALIAAPHAAAGSPIVFESTGSAAGLTATVDAFRAAIGGGFVAGANGSFGGVRREINWDGVPDAFSAPNQLPGNFFNVNSPRGVVLSTAGTGFEVSANAGVAAVEFGNINPTYPADFAPFSAQRLFTALGSTVTDVSFFVPGTNTPATVNAFGAVFADVDLADTSSIQFFDALNNLIFAQSVLASGGSEGLSFLGVAFNGGERIARVRITSGNTPLGPNETPTLDVVAMDDFIYGEPDVTAQTTVPEPASALLLTSGTLIQIVRRRRRAG